MYMVFQKAWTFVTCVLYELQPFRIIDMIDLCKYLLTSFHDIGSAGVMFSDFAYQSAFYWLSSLSRTTWFLIILWLMALAIMNYLEFGSLWILTSMFAFIFLNLGERKEGEMSAYSVFNEGFQQLLGTMNAEQFDNEIRHRAFQREDIQGGEFLQFDDAFEDGFDSEEDAFPARRRLNNRHNRQNNNRQQRRAQQIAAAAAANLEHAGRQQEPNNNINNQIINNIAPAVRRKGKKGRRNYEERLLRRETANLQRRMREGNMDGEFGFNSDIDSSDED